MTQEQLRMQMLAGIITESQYAAKLNEMEGDPEDYYGYQEPVDPNDYADENAGETAEELFQMFKDEGLLNDRREYDVEDLMSTYPNLSQEEAMKLEQMLQNAEGLSESRLNENSNPNRMVELIKMYVDNYYDGGYDSAEIALDKLNDVLNGNLDGYDKAFMAGEEDQY
jgi:hypothetical protein